MVNQVSNGLLFIALVCAVMAAMGGMVIYTEAFTWGLPDIDTLSNQELSLLISQVNSRYFVLQFATLMLTTMAIAFGVVGGIMRFVKRK